MKIGVGGDVVEAVESGEQQPPPPYTENGHKIQSYASKVVLSGTRWGKVQHCSGVQSPTMELDPCLHRTQHWLRSTQLRADNIWGVSPHPRPSTLVSI